MNRIAACIGAMSVALAALMPFYRPDEAMSLGATIGIGAAIAATTDMEPAEAAAIGAFAAFATVSAVSLVGVL